MDTHAPPEATQGTAPDTPKKYIRTLEGDIEAVKKGIIPNLSPLKAPPIPKPEPPKLSPIETYASDFSQRMKDTHASTATVLAAEQDAAPLRSELREGTAPRSSLSNILYSIAGILFLILGIIGSYIAYTRYLTKVEPIILAPAVSTPIFVDEKEKIIGTAPTAIRQAIEQSVTRPLAPNTVRFLYTDFATTTDNSIFSALQLPAPGALLRNLNASRSMAGIINTGENQSPFFILSVASYSDTFAGMLSWEPMMPRDLSALFSPYPQPTVGTTTATTTATASGSQTSNASSGSLTSIPAFRDEVVSNHDVRIYRDGDDRSVLLYGYWNQTTLVIARDPAAFIEILGRLATTRAQS